MSPEVPKFDGFDIVATCLLKLEYQWIIATCLLKLEHQWIIATCLLKLEHQWIVATCLLKLEHQWIKIKTLKNKTIPGQNFRSFLQTGLFSTLYPTQLIKKKYFLTQNPLNYYSLKVINFHGDSVKNESTRTKKLQRGAKRTPHPQPV